VREIEGVVGAEFDQYSVQEVCSVGFGLAVLVEDGCRGGVLSGGAAAG
jgi:hypothetical protein